tara:strand:+ start:28005 stop:28196 length:192 start_codon:yes stop_codon:yes gene_type:complete
MSEIILLSIIVALTNIRICWLKKEIERLDGFEKFVIDKLATFANRQVTREDVERIIKWKGGTR